MIGVKMSYFAELICPVFNTVRHQHAYLFLSPLFSKTICYRLLFVSPSECVC